MRITTSAPTAEWMDLAEWQRDPYDAYRRLRETGPVVWAPALGRYMVTSYTGCRLVEADQETYTADARTALTERALHGKPMVRKDDPAHAEDRAPVNRSLRPKSVREAWAGVFERNAAPAWRPRWRPVPSRPTWTGTSRVLWRPGTWPTCSASRTCRPRT